MYLLFPVLSISLPLWTEVTTARIGLKVENIKADSIAEYVPQPTSARKSVQ